MSKQELAEAVKQRATERHGILLLRPSDALEIVRQAREAQVRVLGLDGFHLSDAGIQPDQEQSVDFSLSPETHADSWTDAEAFLKPRMGRDLYFEVVLDLEV